MALNINEARKIVLDLGQLNLRLYWVDFLLSYAIGILTLLLAYPHPLGSFAFWAWALVSCLAFYRALAFIHEISHFRQRLGSFRLFWNAVAGMPMAFPSFMYTRSHAIHHNPRTYGTSEDGEYIAFRLLSRWQIVGYLMSGFWTPVILIIRFVFLYPPSLFIPPLRKFLVEKGSSIAITFNHTGQWPVGSEKKEWAIMETACCVYWLLAIAATTAGWIPLRLFGVAYLILTGSLFLNAMRTLAAHRFANDGKEMTIEEQLLDSVNLVNRMPYSLFSTLGAPVGLRFHALHHLFPFLPYHSLGKAHRRLSERLAGDSSYHLACDTGVLSACRKIWRREPVPQLELERV